MAEIVKARGVKFIRKSNNLVEGRYRFDIWEMRIFVKMLTMIQPSDEDFKRYRIYLKDIISEFDLEKNNRSYEELKQGAEKLASREIRIPMMSPEGEPMELFTHIASAVKSFLDKRQGKYIEIDFHPDMKPYLLQLQNKFLMYDARNVLKLPSSFSIRIYELLKQYEPIGKRKISIDDLKVMLDIDDKYSLYANLKQRVIIKAQEDLEKYTDIKFTFQEIKRGKAIYELIFFISKNLDIINTRDLPLELEINQSITEEDIITNEIYKIVRRFKGANRSTVEKWVEKYSVEHIQSRINFVLNQIEIGKDIKNPMGLLQKMMGEVNLFDPIQEQKDLEISRKQKAKEEQLLKQKQTEKEAQTKAVKEEYEQAKTQLIESFFEINPTLNIEFLEEFKQLRHQPDCPFIVELAFDHYQTDIEGMAIGSKEELIYNYKLGGSFGAYFLDWFETRFSEDFKLLKDKFGVAP
jgi:plasmid replication initiation protein